MRRRIASRASGGVPKKPLKKLRWLLVGWARVRVHDLIVPSVWTRKGFCAWPLETWKPVTLPTAWQGRSGQDGSGVLEVPPRVTVVVSTLPAVGAAAHAMAATRAPATRSATRRPRRVQAAEAGWEVLGIGTAPLWKRRLSR